MNEQAFRVPFALRRVGWRTWEVYDVDTGKVMTRGRREHAHALLYQLQRSPLARWRAAKDTNNNA